MLLAACAFLSSCDRSKSSNNHTSGSGAPAPTKAETLSNEACEFARADFEKHWSKYGDDWLCRVLGHEHGYWGDTEKKVPANDMYQERKGLRTVYDPKPVTEADSLNGVEWHGDVWFTFSAVRTYYPVDIQQAFSRPAQKKGWTDWTSDESGEQFWCLHLEKRQGKWQFTHPEGFWNDHSGNRDEHLLVDCDPLGKSPFDPIADAAKSSTRDTAAHQGQAGLRDSDGTIVIGEYGSMSGPQTAFGHSTDDGVKLAISEINTRGGVKGRQIHLVVEDDEGKQGEAINAVTRLIEQDHAVAIIGETNSSLSMAGGQVAQHRGVPMISPSSTNPKLTAIGDMVFRACFTDPFQGYVGAVFAKGNLKLGTAAVLYNGSQAYSASLANSFNDEFTKIGGKVLITRAYHGPDTNFSAQLTAIRDTNPEFIYLPGYYTEVVLISQQARTLGITCPLIGGDAWLSGQLRTAGHALDNCFFSDHYAVDDNLPGARDFSKKFNAVYHHDPDASAALGYDAANLLFDAMARAKSLGGPDLAATINGTNGFQGVTGSISIDENRNAKKAAVIERLDNGKFSYFATIQPPP